jgi:hypothetical protein
LYGFFPVAVSCIFSFESLVLSMIAP